MQQQSDENNEEVKLLEEALGFFPEEIAVKTNDLLKNVFIPEKLL
mgnify:CR=1 FL=1